MSMFANRKAYLPLTTNTKYHAVLRTYQEYEPTAEAIQKNPNTQGFVVFKFTLQEDGREISDTRSFPVGTDILARQLLIQTNQPNSTEQIALFRHCIENQIPLDMWVVPNGEYLNYSFQEPTNTAASNQSQSVDSADTFQ